MKPKLLKFFKSEEFVIYSLFLIASWILISQLWGTGIQPGDDAYFAVDRFRRGGILESSLAQSIGQGRFYYLITMTLTQLLYLDDSMVVQNLFKMLADLFVFYSFFRLTKELFGLQTAAFTGLIGIAIFDTYGAAVNPFLAWPMMYGLGAGIQLFSFWLYAKACKNKSSFFSAYSFYFISLIFYEPMVFYSVGYLFIYYFFRSDEIKEFGFISWIKKAFYKNYGLIIALGLYFSAYLIFRYFYPSQYDGNKELTLDSASRIFKTILDFSFGGAKWLLDYNFVDVYRSLALTSIVVFGFIYAFKKLNSQNFRVKDVWHLFKVILVLVFFILCPNFLYGFIEKYRQWVVYSPYYVSSFYSVFAIIMLLGVLTTFLWNSIINQNKYVKNLVIVVFVIIGGIFTFSNISQASAIHLQFRLHGLRWPLIKKTLNELGEHSIPFNTICSNSFVLSPEDTYNYWPLYLSNFYDKKINFQKVQTDNSNCDIYVDYLISLEEKKILLITVPKKRDQSFKSSMAL